MELCLRGDIDLEYLRRCARLMVILSQKDKSRRVQRDVLIRIIANFGDASVDYIDYFLDLVDRVHQQFPVLTRAMILRILGKNSDESQALNAIAEKASLFTRLREDYPQLSSSTIRVAIADYRADRLIAYLDNAVSNMDLYQQYGEQLPPYLFEKACKRRDCSVTLLENWLKDWRLQREQAQLRLEQGYLEYVLSVNNAYSGSAVAVTDVSDCSHLPVSWASTRAKNYTHYKDLAESLGVWEDEWMIQVAEEERPTPNHPAYFLHRDFINFMDTYNDSELTDGESYLIDIFAAETAEYKHLFSFVAKQDKHGIDFGYRTTASGKPIVNREKVAAYARQYIGYLKRVEEQRSQGMLTPWEYFSQVHGIKIRSKLGKRLTSLLDNDVKSHDRGLHTDIFDFHNVELVFEGQVIMVKRMVTIESMQANYTVPNADQLILTKNRLANEMRLAGYQGRPKISLMTSAIAYLESIGRLTPFGNRRVVVDDRLLGQIVDHIIDIEG